MNQLLTEMASVTSQKLEFSSAPRTALVSTTKPCFARLPGQPLCNGLIDIAARISIFKAPLRKSPVDLEVDFEHLADRTEGS